MSNTSNKKQDYMLKMQADIRHGLNSLVEKESWLDLYEEWREEERNQFTSLLMVANSFNLSCVGERFAYDSLDADHMVDLDIMLMSVFLSENLLQLSREIFTKVKKERNRDKKLSLIGFYFGIVDDIVNSPELSGCIVTLNEAAEKQKVL